MTKPALTPFFSIGIASYNRADLLGGCIASCMAQTFTDFEVVVVDGASTDRSADVVRGIADPRIRLVVQSQNNGISSGRHDAVKHARGIWILQMDSDHLLEPHALETLHRLSGSIESDVAAIWARYRWDDGHLSPDFVPASIVDYVRRMQWVEVEGGHDGVFCARREALLETNWFADRRASLDTLFHLNFSKRWRQAYFDDVLAVQISTAGNSSTRAHRGRARMLQKWAPDMAWQYEEILRCHGQALKKHAPRTHAGMRRQAALQNFYSGHRWRGARHGLAYLWGRHRDLGFFPLLVAGVLSPALLRKMNEWRHLIRNCLP